MYVLKRENLAELADTLEQLINTLEEEAFQEDNDPAGLGALYNETKQKNSGFDPGMQ